MANICLYEERDTKKRKACSRLGINLAIIPYWYIFPLNHTHQAGGMVAKIACLLCYSIVALSYFLEDTYFKENLPPPVVLLEE
jgi:hypothetical protein